MQTIGAAPVQALTRTTNVLLGKSLEMERLRAQIAKVAPTSARVLIEGESGVGKEVVARLIHEGSQRAEGLFLAENCAAFPPEIFESELFGHAHGAFTGAYEKRDGILKTANFGTVLLDEVNAMSPALQAKVLRVIETGVFRPVGADKTVSVDVRFLAAGNKDLQEMVRAGTFREDLYYRLAVVVIRIPPLREHKDDIPMIAAHMLGGRDQLSRDASDVLSDYNWPGNVRELQNVLERARIFSDGEEITGSEMEEAITGSRDRIAQTSPGGVAQWSACDTDGRVLGLAEIECKHILAVVERFPDKRDAARALGVSLKTVYNRLHDYRLVGYLRTP